MTEITRMEKFLRACIDGVPCALTPLTRVEKLLAELNETLAGQAPVVILPETELPGGTAETQIPITTPLFATPTAGATAAVTYNGTEYACTVSFVEEDGIATYAMGNFDALGMPFAGSNPDAPFVVVLIPAGMEGVYGILFPLEAEATITLSIVQVGAASGGGSAGGGIFEVNVPVTTHATNTGHDFGEFDKNFTELVAAQKAGKIVRINVNWGTGHVTYGNVIGYAKVGTIEALFISMPVSPNLMQQVAVYSVMAGENGEIVTELIGAD